jgi:DNA-directed RNA polymerase subunit H (RpoH/RPB5)
MSELQQNIEAAQYWTTYENVLKMMSVRGYQIPTNLHKTFSEFMMLYNQCLDEPLVMHAISFVVSKRKRNDEKLILPNITEAITTLLHLKEKSKIKNKENAIESNEVKNNEDDEKKEEEEEKKLVQQFSHELNSNERDVLMLEDLNIPRCEPEEVVVLFCKKGNGALGIEAVMQLLKYQQLLRCMHLILILYTANNSKSVLTTIPRKLLQIRRYPEQTKNGAIVEWFSLLQLSGDITQTVYHTKFEKYTPERAQRWLQQHRLQPHQLETIRLDDPIALYHDYRLGDFIAIHDVDNTTSHVIIGNDK